MTLGITIPFDLVFACEVADCQAAEKTIHQRLAAYRPNQDREFFIIPVEAAEKTVLSVCQEINNKHNYCVANPVIIQGCTNNCSETDVEELPGVVSIPIGSLISSDPGRSTLNDEQKRRIEIIADILKYVSPGTYEEWLEDFSRDRTPENEIKIWEYIARSFVEIKGVELLSEEQKKEAFSILLKRSMMSASKVLQEFELKELTKRAAKEILRGYEADPRPIVVRYDV